MVLIVGLGNPGEKYANTRHNFGFLVLDRFLKDFSNANSIDWSKSTKFKSEICQIDWKPKIGPLKHVLLAKPLTYMNNSGLAVSLIVSYYKIAASDVWIVNDELDLPLGSMKIRFGGAGAGHHGIESVMESLGTDKFWRFRLGIGHSRQQKDKDTGHEHVISKQHLTHAQDIVLSPFPSTERGKVRELIKRGSHAIETALEKDLETAMNRFNSK